MFITGLIVLRNIVWLITDSNSELVRMGYQVGEEKGEDTECLIDSDDKVELADGDTIGQNNTEENKLLESRQLCSGKLIDWMEKLH